MSDNSNEIVELSSSSDEQTPAKFMHDKDIRILPGLPVKDEKEIPGKYVRVNNNNFSADEESVDVDEIERQLNNEADEAMVVDIESRSDNELINVGFCTDQKQESDLIPRKSPFLENIDTDLFSDSEELNNELINVGSSTELPRKSPFLENILISQEILNNNEQNIVTDNLFVDSDQLFYFVQELREKANQFREKTSEVLNSLQNAESSLKEKYKDLRESTERRDKVIQTVLDALQKQYAELNCTANPEVGAEIKRIFVVKLMTERDSFKNQCENLKTEVDQLKQKLHKEEVEKIWENEPFDDSCISDELLSGKISVSSTPAGPSGNQSQQNLVLTTPTSFTTGKSAFVTTPSSSGSVGNITPSKTPTQVSFSTPTTSKTPTKTPTLGKFVMIFTIHHSLF